ncbi:MAG: response regulator, partial [Gammaproteobacteria bacterium]|nr:response regulator [Gammaproteobacteria bacterium]
IAEKTDKKIKGNILLVEDNLSNQKLTKKILEKRGYHVDIVENGRLAVESFARFRHDLILMDIYMPEMDGFEATHEIRAMESQFRENRVPIIALTAHAIDGYREKCLENQMDDFVTKPIKKNILYDAVEQWLDERPTVLIVDDAADNRNLVLHHLKRSGEYQMVTANNGEEAVKIFRRRAISIILMDMEMPVMDGRTATRKIRAFDNGKDIPIIALTAHNDKKYLDQAIDAGCTGFLTKPIRKKDLLHALSQYMQPQTIVHRVDEPPVSIKLANLSNS